MSRKYVLEEAGQTGRPPEIEVFAYTTKKDFGRASVGILEAQGRHGRIRQPISDRGLFLVHTPAYEQDSDVHLDDL